MEDLRAMLNSTPDGEGGPPLAVLYSRCHAVHTQQDRLVASRDFDLISSAVALLVRTQSAVESMGVFSANEDRDDLATADIKYLLVPFYLGSLLSAAPVRTDGATGASAARLALVSQASSALATFLQRCEQYDLLGALGRTAYDAGAAIDPAAKRTFKVDMFRRGKALNAALGALEARRLAAAAQEREDEAEAGGGVASSSGSAAAAAAADAATVAAVAAGGGAGGGSLDEEDERQLWVWRMELAALQALDLQASVKQEVELLRHAAAREAAAAAAGPGPSSRDARAGAVGGGRGRGGAEAPAPSDEDKAELMARLRAICRDLDGNRKEQIRQNVFKPGHTLPTMTVEEAGEIEMREAAEREERQRRQAAKEAARRAELDSDEEDAEDKAKQRAFDDWRDTHPKGYGNSKLRPCG
ncbi:hypothetical protein PLESTB_000561700 [Pleodorina starrii]|uniref:TAP42-like protein n=1 Tax=Pleodorina starrii TaxID=330485 RepID=A0A9W6BHJ2_9CHLO|nr:hypothetical protein PLESTB_000561700 [Pleodorina starrii]GLC74589.1 hypothetical protein PLESTF_001530500 [Pleodorina starrii]